MRSVDIPVNQSDLVDTLSSMRVWLDHSEFPVWGFRSTRDAAGVVTLHAEFDEEGGRIPRPLWRRGNARGRSYDAAREWPPMMRPHFRERRRNETRTSGQAEHYRELSARFRQMADTEHLASLRRHLRRLAAQHNELADDIMMQPNNQAPGD